GCALATRAHVLCALATAAHPCAAARTHPTRRVLSQRCGRDFGEEKTQFGFRVAVSLAGRIEALCSCGLSCPADCALSIGRAARSIFACRGLKGDRTQPA